MPTFVLASRPDLPWRRPASRSPGRCGAMPERRNQLTGHQGPEPNRTTAGPAYADPSPASGL